MIGALKRCDHGIIDSECILCELHRQAVKKIRQQPFFKTNEERWGVSKFMIDIAAEGLLETAKPMKWLGGAMSAIRNQPYYDKVSMPQ